MTFTKLLAATGLVFGMAAAGQANATAVYFFGDSLSDTGNKTAGLPFPYAPGQVTDAFGNGVWANTFAAALGGSAVSSARTGGTNFAEAGARTYSYTSGTTSYRGVGAQVDAFQMAFPLISSTRANDVFVIMIGGNDIQPGLESGNAAGSITSGLTNISNAVIDLYRNSGARHFLIADMPAASATPRVQGLGFSGPFKAYEAGWNVGFAQMIAGLSGSLGGIDVDVLNLSAIAALTESQLTALGFNSALKDKACFDIGAVPPVVTGVATRCAGYLYSDPFHPSAAGHLVIADLALRAVPLPGSVALLGLGLLGLLGSRRFTRK
jgi:phospholipase/lecithinase/hemolysin